MNSEERPVCPRRLRSLVGPTGVFLGVAFIFGAGSAAANQPPQISPLSDIATATSETTQFLTFTVSDPDGPVANLTIAGYSSNPSVVLNSGILLGGGTGSLRSLRIAPVPNASGESTITLIVTDGAGATGSQSFKVWIGPFVRFASATDGLAHSMMTWVDHDSDGDLDLHAFGQNKLNVVRSRMFRNQGGILTETDGPVPALMEGAVAWGDYNNDGHMDVVVTGIDGSGGWASRIYRNSGAGVFTPAAATLMGVAASGAAWGDSDNDGDLDLAISGGTSGGANVTFLYRNDGGLAFVNLNAPLPRVAYSSLDWGDVDGDGDLDLLVAGTPSNFPTNSLARIYRNDGSNVFRESPALLAGAMNGVASLGDMENDGDLDVFIAGWGTNEIYMAKVFRNEGDFAFVEVSAGMTGIVYGSGGWGDFDNDGFLDVAYTGETRGYQPGVWLYRNRSGQSFLDSSQGFTKTTLGSLAWGDLDNDGDLDLAMCGWTNIGIGMVWQVFRNTIAAPNPAPTPPLSRTVLTNGGLTTFRWEPSTDENQFGGLTYNVRLGRTPGGHEVMSAMADSQSGFRKVAARGNAGSGTDWTVRDLAAGRYYWSVQAIDHSFRGSAFAPQGEFVINSPPFLTEVPSVLLHVGQPTARVPFAVSDSLTAASNLVVTVQSSDPNLIAADGLQLVGTGNSRDLFVTPLPDRLGSATITLTVTDEHGGTASRSFPIDVINTVPSISPLLSPYVVSYGVGTAILGFTITDLESPAERLTVEAVSANPDLLPNQNISVQGSGQDRALHMTPAADQTGSAQLRLLVSDPHGGVSERLFVLVVTNHAPQLGSIPTQIGPPGHRFTVPFTVSDVETPAAELVVTAVSTNEAFVPAAGLALGGTERDRTLTINPALMGEYSTVVHVTVTDARGASSTRSIQVRTEEFTELPTTLPPLFNSTVRWGDYDNDGRLDVLLAGRLISGQVTAGIYRNASGGVFFEITAGLTDIEAGTGAWADLDGNGLLDPVLSGFNSGFASLRAYRNQIPSLPSFPQIGGPGPTLTNVLALDLTLADFDHDGDLDLLSIGVTNASSSVALLYRQAARPGLIPDYRFARTFADGTARGGAVGDFDADGDPDLFLGGTQPPQIQRNDFPGGFTRVDLPLPQMLDCTAAWGDLDNDGDLDLAVTGRTNLQAMPVTRMLRNNGANGFVPLPLDGIGLFNGHLSWADYDNDGWLDCLVTGNDGTGARRAQLYGNNGNGLFTVRTNGIPGVESGDHSWGDIDNDGDLDLALTGGHATGYFTRVYRNNLGLRKPNTRPTAPVGLDFLVGRGSVELAWIPASDLDQSGGLTYNLFVQQGGGGTQIMPAMADVTNGTRRVPQAGNVGAATSYFLTNLLPGEYRWSVQAIDHTYAGSDFAPPQTFTIANEPPSISTVPGFPLARNRPSPLLHITVGDFETPASELVLTATSSAANVIAPSNIVVGTSGSLRSVQFTPTGLATGLVTITLTVLDEHGGSANSEFQVDVTQAAPDLAGLPASWTTPFDTATPSLPFTVSDPDDSAETLLVTSRSLNTNLLAAEDILLEGAGANRTLTLAPRANRYGTALVVITVRDPAGATDEHTLELRVSNAAPTLTVPATVDVLPQVGQVTVPLTVGDAETAAENLVIEAQSLGSNFIRSLTISGTGSNRFLNLTLATNRIGSEFVALSATDAGGLASTSLCSIRIQWLVETSTSLTNLAYTSVALGDIDNDDDLDLALSGFQLQFGTTVVYRNGLPGFAPLSNAIPAGVQGIVDWGDYDNDGDLDLVLIRATGSRIYENNGSGDLTEREAGLPAVSASSVMWGDYDGDGRSDLLLAGVPWQDLRTIRVFRNTGAKRFEEVSTGLPPTHAGAGEWADFDNDGDWDIAMVGSGPTTNSPNGIYRNDDGRWVYTASLEPLGQIAMAWGDIDNDGDLDLAVSGGRPEVPQQKAMIYRNVEGVFTALPVHLPGVSSVLAWGDLDNDGLVDLALGGKPAVPTGLPYQSVTGMVIRNAPAGMFSTVGAWLAPFHLGAFVWGDLDGDADLDLMASGSIGVNLLPATRLYRNASSFKNTPPTSPLGLIAQVDLENTVSFQWNPSADVQTTNAAALTYNIRVGTTPGGSEIVSAESGPSGVRRVVARGNTGARTRRALRDLPAGTYYWSVQAVDTAFAGSAFAPEQTFVITNARPSLSSISDQRLLPGRASAPIPFVIGDAETAVDALGITLNSSNPLLISESMMVIDGSGAQRSLIVTPRNDGGGASRITVTVTDSHGASRSVSFLAAVDYFTGVTNLSPALDSAAAWGDTDNDGDLDLVVSGYTSNFTTFPIVTTRGLLWRNDGGARFLGGNTVSALDRGTVDWGDFDLDGDVDLLQTGGSVLSFGIMGAFLLRNNGVGGLQSVATLLPVLNSAADWGDFDNDGDLDLVVAGRRDSVYTNLSTRIYLNNGFAYPGGSPVLFSNSSIVLPGIHGGAALWADFDNDHDLDLLLTGAYTTQTNSPGLTRLYRNDGGSNLVEHAAGLPGLVGSAAAWADYDQDGDLDLALSGFDGLRRRTALFRADGLGGFIEIPAAFPGVSEGRLTWADFDRDGWIDLLVTGSTNGMASGGIARLYRNEGGVGFIDADVNLPGVSRGCAAWGDFDRDGDPDLFLAGSGSGGSVAHVFRNESAPAGAGPPVPEALAARVAGQSVTLEWSTPLNPLGTPVGVSSYNLRVGRSPADGSIMSAQASPDGTRRVAEHGNAGVTGSWRISHLKPGLYFWSVQSIGNTYVGSPFSPPQSFFITNTPPMAIGQHVTMPEDTGSFIVLQAVDPDRQPLTYEVTAMPTNGFLAFAGAPIVRYQPHTHYFGPDSFAFKVADGAAESAPAVVRLTITPVQDVAALNLSLRNLPDGRAELTLRGEPLARHLIDASEDLVAWSELTTVTADGDGTIVFADALPDPAPRQRFYRTRLAP